MLQKLICLFIGFTFLSVNAQQRTTPYEWNWTQDGIWTGAALGTSAYGLKLIRTKDDISLQKLNEEINNKDNINFLDKWAVGNNSQTARKTSDIPFVASFAAPFVLLLDDEVNDHTLQVMGLYLESIATTGALYTVTAGLVNRSRPYVYNETTPEFRRFSKNGQRSFYSGHVAATATATFFTAKVFQDFNPDSKAVPYVWTGAAVLPAAVGYFRLQAGEHFLTDVLLGYGLGALVGYYVPELHKNKDGETQLGFTTFTELTPFGDRYDGISLNYRF